MKIYVFGNPLVQEDSEPLNLIQSLGREFPDIEFIAVDPNENFPPEGESHPLILDTVKGIDRPCLLSLNDIAKIKITPVSPHDYDLLFHLWLLKKTGRIVGAKIIALPYDGKTLSSDVAELIKSQIVAPARCA